MTELGTVTLRPWSDIAGELVNDQVPLEDAKRIRRRWEAAAVQAGLRPTKSVNPLEPALYDPGEVEEPSLVSELFNPIGVLENVLAGGVLGLGRKLAGLTGRSVGQALKEGAYYSHPLIPAGYHTAEWATKRMRSRAAQRASGAAEQFALLGAGRVSGTSEEVAAAAARRLHAGVPAGSRPLIPLGGISPRAPVDVAEVFDLGNALGVPRHRVGKIIRDFGIEGAHEQLRRMAPEGVKRIKITPRPSPGVQIGESIGPSPEAASIRPVPLPYETDYMQSLRGLLRERYSSLTGGDTSKIKRMVNELLRGRTEEELTKMSKGRVDLEKKRIFDRIEMDRRSYRNALVREKHGGVLQSPTIAQTTPTNIPRPVDDEEARRLLQGLQ